MPRRTSHPHSRTRLLTKFFQAVINYIRAEPALIMTFAGSLVGAPVSLGLRLDADKQIAVVTFIGLIVGLVIRQNVSPIKKG